MGIMAGGAQAVDLVLGLVAVMDAVQPFQACGSHHVAAQVKSSGPVVEALFGAGIAGAETCTVLIALDGCRGAKGLLIAPWRINGQGREMTVKTEIGPGVVRILVAAVRAGGRRVGYGVAALIGGGVFQNCAVLTAVERDITGSRARRHGAMGVVAVKTEHVFVTGSGVGNCCIKAGCGVPAPLVGDRIPMGGIGLGLVLLCHIGIVYGFVFSPGGNARLRITGFD